MNNITKSLLEMVSDIFGTPQGAYNIREDGECAGRQSTEQVEIIPKTDKPGIDIMVKAGKMCIRDRPCTPRRVQGEARREW